MVRCGQTVKNHIDKLQSRLPALPRPGAGYRLGLCRRISRPGTLATRALKTEVAWTQFSPVLRKKEELILPAHAGGGYTGIYRRLSFGMLRPPYPGQAEARWLASFPLERR